MTYQRVLIKVNVSGRWEWQQGRAKHVQRSPGWPTAVSLPSLMPPHAAAAAAATSIAFYVITQLKNFNLVVLGYAGWSRCLEWPVRILELLCVYAHLYVCTYSSIFPYLCLPSRYLYACWEVEAATSICSHSWTHWFDCCLRKKQTSLYSLNFLTS